MILSIEGSNVQTITDNGSIPSGYIEMLTERPSMLHLAQVDGTWLQDLDLTKEAKTEETWQEATRRMGSYVFAMGTDAIAEYTIASYAAGLYVQLPTAGSDMDKCVQINAYFKTQRDLINAMTTVAEVEAYDPVNDTGWPY